MIKILNIVIVIAVFLFVVLWHEFGHFLVAKLVGVKVNEFSIGMGPTLLKSSKGETVYSLRALPIGGFVALEGEEDGSEDERSFKRAKIWKRMLIILAGATMNFILGFLILLIFQFAQGVQVPVVASFIENSPAQIAGMEIGDRITKINGSSIATWDDVIETMQKSSDNNITIEIITNKGKKKQVDVNASRIEGKYVIGIYPDIEKANFSTTVREAAAMFQVMLFSLLNFLKSIFGGNFDAKGISGPVGVISIISEAANTGIIPVLFWLAYININLGVINLLPIPALDGGKFLFIVIEALRGKAIDPEKEAYVHLLGFVLLMGIMLFATYQDIIKLIS